MVMNPDGTGQRAMYGSNSWFPNGLYSPRELPGSTGKFLCILAGYHGSNRNGHLVIVDTTVGTREHHGIVQRISGRGLPLEVKYMDRLTEQEWPKFSTPAPITSTQFLVSAQIKDDPHSIGLYLADTKDTLRLIRKAEGYALLEPIPVVQRPTPPGIPDRIDSKRDDATVFLQDVHVGQGLAGVPRGVVRRLRVIAYNFGYVGLAGTDKIGLSGPWEAMRIIGTTPVTQGGSASFRVGAGAILPQRDVVDERLLNDIKAGTGMVIDSQTQVGGWPVLDAGEAPPDRDADGMPDAWEHAHQLDPDSPEDQAIDADGDGYTNLEAYLNELSVHAPQLGESKAGL